MIKPLFLFLFLIQTAFCVDYSEMSTQELLAIIGYVKPENQSKFTKELESRKKSMNKQEKEVYEKNKHKLEKK
jgi:hypothetical protein